MQLNKNIAYAITLLLVSIALTSQAAFARALSISAARTADGMTQAWVKCTNRSVQPVIKKRPDTKTWCDAASGTLCNADKVKLANEVCSSAYQATLKAQEEDATSSVAQNELQEEQLAIEQSLIRIQARRLELKRRELELKKQLITLQ